MFELFSSSLDKINKHELNIVDLVRVTAQMRTARELDFELKLYQAWLEQNTNNPLAYKIYLNYALALSHSKDLVAARNTLYTTIKINPDFIPAYIKLGELLVSLNETNKAIEYWQQALDKLASIHQSTGLDNQQTSYNNTLLRCVGHFSSEQMRVKTGIAVNPTTIKIAPSDRAAGTQRIDHVMLEVATACHFDCAECAHGELRKTTKKYQLSVNQVIQFLQCSKSSNYHIDRLIIHGPGEPFLWKHFDESMALIHKSKVINHIKIVTNGKGMDRIADVTWNYMDAVELSLYDPEQTVELKSSLSNHKKKIDVKLKTAFWSRAKPEDVPIEIPCQCLCDGPMLLGDVVFLYCGPPVFDAAKLLGINIWDRKELYVKVGNHYLASMNDSMKGNMDICRYCWGNSHYLKKANLVKINTGDGGWQ